VGGGTVAYVNPSEHRYLDDPVHREEGGTPAIIESIRAGLVFQLKQAVGVATIREREEAYWQRAVAAWSTNPALQVLGNTTAERLSIVSFVVRRPEGRYLHHNFVVALLSDLFGIQSRGGCSCAGPYGHRLLGIDLERSHEFEHEITQGCEGIKPGWTRVSFNYFISEAVFQYLVAAVDMVAEHGWKLLPEYRFDPASGLWRHMHGPVEPRLRLGQLRYDTATGDLVVPELGHDRAPESALAGYLTEARERFDAASATAHASPAAGRLSVEFEHLRWFELPAESLVG
jgi:Aminotransferase class-V